MTFVGTLTYGSRWIFGNFTSTLGNVKQTSSVQRAHAKSCSRETQPPILDANINRSPTAYLADPEDEHARYQYDQDKDEI